MDDHPPANPERAMHGDASAVSSFDLLLRAKSGDDSAVDELCRRYLPRLRRWASGRLPRWAREAADTEDLLQDTLLRTVARLGAFEPRHEGAFQAYLRQAVLNRIKSELRRVSRHGVAGEIPADAQDASPSPLEMAIGGEALERYESALDRLKSGEREAVILRVEFGCAYDEIARALDKPSAEAARVAVSRAVSHLVKEMERGGAA